MLLLQMEIYINKVERKFYPVERESGLEFFGATAVAINSSMQSFSELLSVAK